MTSCEEIAEKIDIIRGLLIHQEKISGILNRQLYASMTDHQIEILALGYAVIQLEEAIKAEMQPKEAIKQKARITTEKEITDKLEQLRELLIELVPDDSVIKKNNLDLLELDQEELIALGFAELVKIETQKITEKLKDIRELLIEQAPDDGIDIINKNDYKTMAELRIMLIALGFAELKLEEG